VPHQGQAALAVQHRRIEQPAGYGPNTVVGREAVPLLYPIRRVQVACGSDGNIVAHAATTAVCAAATRPVGPIGLNHKLSSRR
jgi:hypothetical protein